MKMLMLFVPSDCLEDVQALMDEHDLHAYTEIPYVPGAGRSGRKMGTRAFPGTSSMLLAVLRPEEADRLRAALRDYSQRATCREEIRLFAIDTEVLI